MKCKKCHNDNIDGVKFCFYCGCELTPDNNSVQENSANSNAYKEDIKTPSNLNENNSANETISNKKTGMNKKFVIVGSCVAAAILIVVGIVVFNATNRNVLNNQELNNSVDYSESYNNDDNEKITENTSSAIDEDYHNDYIDDNESDNKKESLSAEIKYDSEESSLSDAYYFTDARASSVLPDEYEYNYSAENVLNNDSTCWCEGSSGLGVGEWIELDLPETQLLYGINIVNGYAGTQKQYTYNSKVNRICLEFSDGSTLHTSLKVFDPSSRKTVQTIEFNYPVETSSVKITIEGVEKGECDDTCITYIAPYVKW